MIAFLIAGLILGLMARALRSAPGTPTILLTVGVGVVGAVVGGVGMNLLIVDEAWTDLNPYSLTSACVISIVLLGLLEGGVGRKA